MKKIADLSLVDGISLAAAKGKPKKAGRILAKSLARECSFFTPQLAVEFAACLLRAINTGKPEVPPAIYKRIARWPIKRAAYLAAKQPEAGMRVLAGIVFEHLTKKQGLSRNEILEFTTQFLNGFIPVSQL